MTNPSLTLILVADIPEAKLAQLTRDLGRHLSREGVKAKPVELPPVLGEKGDSVTLGQLALTSLTSGAVTALIECLKAYIARERSLTIKLTCPDGKQVDVNARNVDAPAVREVLEAVASAKVG